MAIKFQKSEKYNFNRNLAKREKVVPHLEKYIAQELEGFSFEYETKVHDDAWHPSGHCTPSPSELYFFATEGHLKPRNFSVGLYKTFMVGHFWHQYLQYAAVECGIAEPEAIERVGQIGWGHTSVSTVRDSGSHRIPWSPWNWATGAGDIAPATIPRHGEFIVDFKTMGDHDYKKSGVPDWCAGKYEAQIQMYMDFFDLERGIIVAVQKGTPHEMKEFEYVRDQTMIDTIRDKWEFVSACLEAEHKPTEEEDAMFDLVYRGPTG